MEYDAQANWERIQAAIAMEQPDQVPVFLHTTGPFMAAHADIGLYDYFLSAELMFQALIVPLSLLLQANNILVFQGHQLTV